MPANKKATDEEIVEAYLKAKSVWGAAELLSMCGQSVHERLTKLGMIKNNHFTPDEVERLVREYVIFRDNGKLQELAALMGRTKHLLCRKARELGFTNKDRHRFDSGKWKYMSEEAATVMMDEFKKSSLGMTQFCTKKGYGINGFHNTMNRYFGDEWESVIEAKRPRQTMYRLGRQLEYAVRDSLKGMGMVVMRSPGSKTPIDINAVGSGIVLFIQCKRSGSVSPKEWNELYELAQSVGATALVASRPTGRGIKYMRIIGPKIPHGRRPPWEEITIERGDHAVRIVLKEAEVAA